MTLPRFVTAVIVVLQILSGSGCRVRETDQRTVIRFAIWGSAAQQKVEQAIVDQFEQLNPDIRVEIFAIGKRYDEKIQSMMVGGVAPDVMMVIMEQYANWAARGVLADLTAMVEELGHEDRMMPVPRRAFEIGGRFFAVPVNVHGLVTYVNLDALATIGVTVPDEGFTWAEIERLGPRLSRRLAGPTAPVEYALLGPPYYPTLHAFGGNLFDDPSRPTRAMADSPQTRSWIEWYRGLEDSGWMVPRELAADAGTYQLFRDGRVAFFFSGRWQVPDFADKTSFHWDIRPFPAGPAGHVTMHGGSGIAVSATTRHPEAARRFVRFYGSVTGARAAMRAGRTVPVWEGLARSNEFLDQRPPDSSHHFVSTMEAGRSGYWLYAPGGADIARIVNSRMDEALADAKLPAEVVAVRLQDDLDRWLARQRDRGRLEP